MKSNDGRGISHALFLDALPQSIGPPRSRELLNIQYATGTKENPSARREPKLSANGFIDGFLYLAPAVGVEVLKLEEAEAQGTGGGHNQINSRPLRVKNSYYVRNKTSNLLLLSYQ